MTTYANWVAKTASLLAEEHDLERGQSLRVDLPDALARPGLPRSGLGARADRHRGRRTRRRGVRAGGSRPLGAVRRPHARAGVLAAADRRAVRRPAARRACTTWGWRSGRSRTPSRRGTRQRGRIPRSTGRGAELTHDELWSRAAAGTSHYSGGGRLLSTANPASPSGLAAFTGPLGGGGSVVLVSVAPSERGPDAGVRRRSGARSRFERREVGQPVTQPARSYPLKPCARKTRDEKPVRRARQQPEVPGLLLPHHDSGMAVDPHVANAHHPVVALARSASARRAPRNPPGPLPG